MNPNQPSSTVLKLWSIQCAYNAHYPNSSPPNAQRQIIYVLGLPRKGEQIMCTWLHVVCAAEAKRTSRIMLCVPEAHIFRKTVTLETIAVHTAVQDHSKMNDGQSQLTWSSIIICQERCLVWNCASLGDWYMNPTNYKIVFILMIGFFLLLYCNLNVYMIWSNNGFTTQIP